MGIRYEKDTILNWINEMGKFLRLLVDRYEAFDEPVDTSIVEEGYREFFKKERAWLLERSTPELQTYVDEELQVEQIRPLALLFLRDALLLPAGEEQQQLLQKSKFLFGHASSRLNSFSFEDYEHLAIIDKLLILK